MFLDSTNTQLYLKNKLQVPLFTGFLLRQFENDTKIRPRVRGKLEGKHLFQCESG